MRIEPRIKVHETLPAGFQHPENLHEYLFWLAQMFDGVDRVNHVDTVVGQRDRCRGCFDELNDVAIIPPRVLQIVRNQIRADGGELFLLEETMKQVTAVTAKIQDGLVLK